MTEGLSCFWDALRPAGATWGAGGAFERAGSTVASRGDAAPNVGALILTYRKLRRSTAEHRRARCWRATYLPRPVTMMGVHDVPPTRTMLDSTGPSAKNASVWKITAKKRFQSFEPPYPPTSSRMPETAPFTSCFVLAYLNSIAACRSAPGKPIVEHERRVH